jgi:D-beta-D-heptose 7-phosphate kinase/D-beta-D-heptose 1-phosphate adenosyltransferase
VDPASAVRGLEPVRALVVGDVILDRYVEGAVERINPEAPVPVVHARRERFALGGAANVARNLRALGCDVALLGVVGDDEAGETLRALCESEAIDAAGLLQDPGRPTTRKTRVISRSQHIVRVDWEEARPLSADLEARFAEAAFGDGPAPGVVVLSDYAKGMLAGALVQSLVKAGREKGVPVLVDPKGRDFSKYAGAHLVTPNRGEAEAWSHRALEGDAEVREVLAALKAKLDLRASVVTLGAEGMAWLDEADRFGRLAAEAREVFDITGAGDTVIATLACFLGAGLPLETALRIANVAASISVGSVGTVSVSREEILQRLEGERPPWERKRIAREDLEAWARGQRDRGRRVVFTNGCFDVLHRGHVEYLRFCRDQGDVLVVGLNSDASVRALKGEGRPVNPEEDRAAVLAALESVDAVSVFGEETPAAIIEQVCPDVLVKGEDWRDKGVVGREFVEGRGGTVVLAPLLEGYSSSGTIRKLEPDEHAD